MSQIRGRATELNAGEGGSIGGVFSFYTATLHHSDSDNDNVNYNDDNLYS